MFDVITIGRVTRDIIFVTPKGHLISTPEFLTEQIQFCFEYGAKIASEDVYFTLGGGANNTVVGLARLGLRSAAIFRIGQDEAGTMAIKNLINEGVDNSFVQIDKKLSTGLSFIIVNAAKDDGDHTVFVYIGANAKLVLNEARELKVPEGQAYGAGKSEKLALSKVSGESIESVEGLKVEIQNSKWLYITSLSGDWQAIIGDIIEIKKKNKNLKIAFNPGAAQLKKGIRGLKNILKITEILFLNRDEARELCLSINEKDNIDDIKILFKEIIGQDPKILAITDGLGGAYVSTGDNKRIIWAPASSKKRVDTTGAGDAFGSGFLGGYILSQGNLETALKYGIINSGNVVAYYGAQGGLMKAEEIVKRLETIKVKMI